MKETLRVVYFNVALFCVLLVGLESAGQVGFYVLKGYPVWQADQHRIAQSQGGLFELHPWLVARLRAGAKVQQGRKTITTTSERTRSTGAPDLVSPEAIRIAVVGGSTTFGSGLTDEDTWPARLQALLGPGYQVINYGMPGYSTAEAVIQMGLLVPESRPDIVVFFEGWNDLHNAHDSALGADYYRHGLRQYSNLGVERPHATRLLAKIAELSAIGHLAVTLAKPAQTTEAPPTPVTSLHADPDTLVERVYARNLQTLKRLAQGLGAKVFFVPQIVDPSRLTSGSSGHPWTPTIVDSAMPALMGRMNRIMETICTPPEPNCEVLIDIARHRWVHDEFLDEGHFQRQGSDTFAALLAAHLRAVRPLRSEAQ